MKYEKLTSENQKSMLESRLVQYEQEHYSHSINLALLRAAGVDDDATKAAIAQAEKAMATLDTAHASTKKELDKIQLPSTPPTPPTPPTPIVT